MRRIDLDSERVTAGRAPGNSHDADRGGRLRAGPGRGEAERDRLGAALDEIRPLSEAS